MKKILKRVGNFLNPPDQNKREQNKAKACFYPPSSTEETEFNSSLVQEQRTKDKTPGSNFIRNRPRPFFESKNSYSGTELNTARPLQYHEGGIVKSPTLPTVHSYGGGNILKPSTLFPTSVQPHESITPRLTECRQSIKEYHKEPIRHLFPNAGCSSYYASTSRNATPTQDQSIEFDNIETGQPFLTSTKSEQTGNGGDTKQMRSLLLKSYEMKHPSEFSSGSQGSDEVKHIAGIQGRPQCDTKKVSTEESSTLKRSSLNDYSHHPEKRSVKENITKTDDIIPAPVIEEVLSKTAFLDFKTNLQERYLRQFESDRKLEDFKFSFDIRTLKAGVVYEQQGTLENLISPGLRNTILVYGSPGFGKTALCRTLGLQWARAMKGNLIADGRGRNLLGMGDYEICILYDLANISSADVEREILNSVRSLVPDGFEDSDTFLSAWKLSMSRTMLVLDSYHSVDEEFTEHLKSFLERRGFFKNASVVMTTNPIEDALSPVFPKMADIRGLSPETLASVVGNTKSLEDFLKNSKVCDLYGCSPLFTRLIADILNRQMLSDSLYSLIESLMKLLIERHIGNVMSYQDIQTVLLNIGMVLFWERKKSHYSFTEDQLPITINKKHVKSVLKFEIFHKIRVTGKPTVISITHPVFMSYLGLNYLRQKWSTLKVLQYQTFLNNTLNTKLSSEEYFVDALHPETAFYLGVIPSFVLRRTFSGIEGSLFHMSQDVPVSGLSAAFETRSLLLRMDEQLLSAYRIRKVENHETEEDFYDVINCLDCSSPVDASYYRDRDETTTHLKVTVIDDDTKKPMLLGVFSRKNSVVPQDGNLLDNYKEIFLDMPFLQIPEIYSVLQNVLASSFEPCFLEKAVPSEASAELVYNIMLAALECRKNMHAQICLASASEPCLVTLEVLSRAQHPTVASIAITMPNETRPVRYYKNIQSLKDAAGKSEVTHILDSFLGKVDNPFLSINFTSNFVSKNYSASSLLKDGINFITSIFH